MQASTKTETTITLSLSLSEALLLMDILMDETDPNEEDDVRALREELFQTLREATKPR
jgi:hypothetical protein